jgi:hypothetical protein
MINVQRGPASQVTPWIAMMEIYVQMTPAQMEPAITLQTVSSVTMAMPAPLETIARTARASSQGLRTATTITPAPATGVNPWMDVSTPIIPSPAVMETHALLVMFVRTAPAWLGPPETAMMETSALMIPAHQSWAAFISTTP